MPSITYICNYKKMASRMQPNFKGSLKRINHFGMEATIEYRGLTEDQVEEALAVQQQSMRQESIALGVGMFEDPGAAEEMKLVFREVARDGCTVVAVDVFTEEVVAVSFNKLHVPLRIGERCPLEAFVDSNIKHKPCLGLINFIDNVESRVDLFERYKAGCLMEIFYVGTDSRYRGCRIGQHMVEVSLELARQLGEGKLVKTPVGRELVHEQAKPEVAFGVFTSTISQRIAEKLNFDFLTTVYYDDYVIDGKKFSERIGNTHKTARLGAIRL